MNMQDMRVLDDVVEKIVDAEGDEDDDEDSDDDEEEVMVMVSESEVENAQRRSNTATSSSSSSGTASSSSNRIGNSSIRSRAAGIARSHTRNTNTIGSSDTGSANGVGSRPNLLIRPPSFNRVFSNLTNSPLASASPTPFSLSLARSHSNKSLLGGSDTSSDSPTSRDFQLLSEHLQDCEFNQMQGCSEEQSTDMLVQEGPVQAQVGSSNIGRGEQLGLRISTVAI